MKNPDRLLAEKLLKINAIKLQPEIPFIWGSGWNSPIYNDNRRILSYPDVRNFVKIELARTIIEKFPQAEVVASVSVGAIAIGAIVAESLGLPFIFLRDTPKDHGLENLIEGNLKPGQNVVMVDDIVSTGASTIRAAEIITEAGGVPLGGVAVFNYEFPMAIKRLRNENIDFESLSTYSVMLDAALDLDYISLEDTETLKEWRKDPANWVPNNNNHQS